MLNRLLGWLFIILGRRYADMALVYVTLIVKGCYAFAQVPASQQDKVREILAAMDLDENGNPI